MIQDTRYFLVGDIGGTNTNLGIARCSGSKVEVLYKASYSTQQERSLSDPVRRFLRSAHDAGLPEALDYCCVSGAGPVEEGRRIQLTNAPWSIERDELADILQCPISLINDFTALGYAVGTVDWRDAKAVARLPHTDGSLPEPRDGMMLILGAGTGLGVGFVDRHQTRLTAYPSEGGHSELPVFDDLSRSFHAWLSNVAGYPPGAELAISGQGIANIFEFVCTQTFDQNRIEAEYGLAPGSLGRGITPLAASILARPRQEWPPAIASGSASDPWCRLAMELFTRLYAQKAANLTAIFLPEGGVWLAGGISSRNEAWLLENGRFMRWFERNYAPHIRTFLAKTPVCLVRDYHISLRGAAEAARQHLEYGA